MDNDQIKRLCKAYGDAEYSPNGILRTGQMMLLLGAETTLDAQRDLLGTLLDRACETKEYRLILSAAKKIIESKPTQSWSDSAAEYPTLLADIKRLLKDFDGRTEEWKHPKED